MSYFFQIIIKPSFSSPGISHVHVHVTDIWLIANTPGLVANANIMNETVSNQGEKVYLIKAVISVWPVVK